MIALEVRNQLAKRCHQISNGLVYKILVSHQRMNLFLECNYEIPQSAEYRALGPEVFGLNLPVVPEVTLVTLAVASPYQSVKLGTRSWPGQSGLTLRIHYVCKQQRVQVMTYPWVESTKSKTESTSGSTKWWYCPRKNKNKNTKNDEIPLWHSMTQLRNIISAPLSFHAILDSKKRIHKNITLIFVWLNSFKVASFDMKRYTTERLSYCI